MIALVGLAILIYVIIAVRSGQKHKNAGTVVEISNVSREELVTTVSGSGVADTQEKEEIRAEITGLISKIHVLEGDWVKKGDLLLTFNDRHFRRAVTSAENALKAAEFDSTLPSLEEARLVVDSCRKAHDRVALLYQQGAATKEDLEEAVLKLKQAEIRWEQTQKLVTIKREEAQLSLAAAQQELAGTRVTASRDGRVIYCPVKEGMSIVPGTFLCEIGNLETLTVEFGVDEIDISQINPEQVARITHDGLPGMEFTGSVEQVALKGITKGNECTFPVKIRIDNTMGKLRPGMTVDVEIETARVKETLTLPLLAVLEEEESIGAVGKYVFMVVDGTAVKTRVITGLSNESSIEIKEGLNEGDPYISGDYDTIIRLKDGTKVRPKKTTN